MKAAFPRIHRLDGAGVFRGIGWGGLALKRQQREQKQQWKQTFGDDSGRVGQIASFKTGMQTLPDAIVKVIGQNRVKTQWELKHVKHVKMGEDLKNDKKHVFIATFDTPNGKKIVKTKSLLISTPPKIASQLVSTMVPSAKLLADIPSPPVASVVTAYPISCVRKLVDNGNNLNSDPLAGFGVLMPRSEKIRSLGIIFCSSLFPDRVPTGNVLLTTFIGGSHDEEVKHLSEDQLYRIAHNDIKKLLLHENAPEAQRISCKMWPAAIPQYCQGHNEMMELLRNDEAKVPGLYLGGNYRGGVAVGDCIANGMQTANSTAKYLKT
eukprot:CAMPEP_0114335762 /NCGR_PEP_ID=MMETSP0101-20121206/5267_1 /TAXON_ID=38822 ORGANISM="Pteridomonas danica, Strain PT" /NCGR_SAMPLE_ID=MMETSP0101 /ASSEMBLY_ACC=CAM_ASM_000211 /LENGTH=321 /DNA_ID=CAMNT_0001467481 /DNA_START=778 /DNA_END=1743 /DNA_ORIENTATION=-